jgi:hypothetical protein
MEIRRQLLSTLAVFQRRRRLVSISWVAEELQRPIKKFRRFSEPPERDTPLFRV